MTDKLRRIDAFVVALALAFGAWDLVATVTARTVSIVVAMALPVASLGAFAWISFRVWRLSADCRGSRLARTAFVTYLVVVLLSLLTLLIVVLLLAVRATSHLPAVTQSLLPLIAVETVAGLLLSLGLLRTRLVPAWVAWLGLIGSVLLVVLMATRFVLSSVGGSSPLDEPLWIIRLVVQITFLASLGVTLFWKRPGSRDHEPSQVVAAGT